MMPAVLFCSPLSLSLNLCLLISASACAVASSSGEKDAQGTMVDAVIFDDGRVDAFLVDGGMVDGGVDVDAVLADAALPDAQMVDALPIDGCVPEWVQLLVSPGFEDENSVWNESTNGSAVIRSSGLPWMAQSGSYAVYFLGFNYGEQKLEQSFIVPMDATAVRFRGYRCFVTNETTSSMSYDLLKIRLQAGSDVLESLASWSNLDGSGTCSWGAFEVEAGSVYAGQTISLVMEAESDVNKFTTFGLDSLVFEAFACPVE